MPALSSKLAAADPSDPAQGEAIIDLVQQDLVTGNVAADGLSHPSLLIFLVRKLTEPAIQCDEIPRLLDVLASLESVRRVLVKHACDGLQLHQKSTERGITRLRKSDEKKLRVFTDENLINALRQVFREDILFNLYRLHICHLWTSQQSSMIIKTMKRYFPSNYACAENPFADQFWKDPLYIDFSVEERVRVHSVGEEMKGFLLQCRAWDLEREEYFGKLGISEEVAFGENDFISYSRDFNAKFRNSTDEWRLMQGLGRHLDKIHNMVDTLEKLFPGRQEVEGAEVS